MAKTIISVNDAPTMTLPQKLAQIQIEFKAQKNQFNKFGNYKFRSAEDILEALKPINQKFNVYFTINEQLINSNPPIMNSVATIWDCESSHSIDCTAVVGVDLEQKGMAMAQRFGATSSYGKKYALGNLLLIDDTADADATNNHGKDTVKETDKEWLNAETDAYRKAVDYISGGGDIELVLKKYKMSKEIKESLLKSKQ